MSNCISDEAIEFLCRAKKSTYAAGGHETKASRPNSHDLEYSEGNMKYYDTYVGGERFAGEEAIWENDMPLWSMNYVGRVLGDEFSGSFLKEALGLVTSEYPFRGPVIHQNGQHKYHCIVNGDVEWFQGYEEIYFNENKVYECYFHGGLIR